MTGQLDLVAAFLIGLFGSGHCLVMCGGMASALQMMMTQQSAKRRLLLQLTLSAGRVSSYSLMGALVGALGFSGMAIAGGGSQFLQIFAGMMLILMALYIAKISTLLLAIESLGNRLWRWVRPFSQKMLPLDALPKAFIYGLCWGYLPCGLVYSALSWALASGSMVSGAHWMACFGLGTLPALLFAGQAAQLLQKFTRAHKVRLMTALLLSSYGLYTIYLALQRLVF